MNYKFLVFAALAIFSIYSVTPAISQKPLTTRTSLIKPIAPAFTLSDTAGHAQTVREFQGHPIALFFFCGCPWCRECARTWGEFQRGGALADGTGKTPMTVVVFGGTAGEAAAFEAQTGLVPGQTTVLLDPDLRVTLGMYHAEPCPRVFVLDAGQTVRYTNDHKNDSARSAPALAIDSRALSVLRAAEAEPRVRVTPAGRF